MVKMLSMRNWAGKGCVQYEWSTLLTGCSVITIPVYFALWNIPATSEKFQILQNTIHESYHSPAIFHWNLKKIKGSDRNNCYGPYTCT